MDVLQYHARRMHLMAWQLQLAEQQKAARLQREYLLTTHPQLGLSHGSKTRFEMYNSINSEIIKLVPHVIIIREGSL